MNKIEKIDCPKSEVIKNEKMIVVTIPGRDLKVF